MASPIPIHTYIYIYIYTTFSLLPFDFKTSLRFGQGPSHCRLLTSHSAILSPLSNNPIIAECFLIPGMANNAQFPGMQAFNLFPNQLLLSISHASASSYTPGSSSRCSSFHVNASRVFFPAFDKEL
ncbi:hypothetical protein HYC85_024484 [Camellia sinensis]|uniref:Uncharacterized protein n=1 Tax=Camellia sinensis TaxID=4442 RepID=A0A7J7GBV4_CAMSI|nr:hypothetical protein HYC85_024484 [Camellia sinensis]